MDGRSPVSPRVDARIPVVLLHGALRSGLGMLPTAWALRRRGLDARAFDYSARHGSLADHALLLSRFVDAWLGHGPHAQLGFLSHSMGGLVVRAYLAGPGRGIAERIRVVMLSPPNRGSVLAARYRHRRWFSWLYRDAATALQPEQAAALPRFPAEVEVLILAGGTGNPEGGYNAAIPGDNDGVLALREMELPPHRVHFVGGFHSLLQWEPRVLQRAGEFLVGAGSSVLGSSAVPRGGLEPPT